MRQVIRTALKFHRLYDTDGSVSDMFQDVFNYQNCNFTYINAGFYIELLVSKAISETQGRPVLRPLSNFETLFSFHFLSFFETSVVKIE